MELAIIANTDQLHRTVVQDEWKSSEERVGEGNL
jgi:hypothetical protein